MSGGATATTLSIEEVRNYLDEAARICGQVRTVDIHVHATEVIKAKHQYGMTVDGVASSESAGGYRPPSLANIRLSAAPVSQTEAMQNRLSEMAFTRAYQHTGPRVLADQLNLAGINVAALLPVAGPGESIAGQMQVIEQCCSGDDRFIAGYGIAPTIPNEGIVDDLTAAVERFGVQIVKAHPNLSGIDLASEAGKARLEAILIACNQLNLPILLHGGCSPILGDAPAREFSTMEKLQEIDWSLTSSAVVIAHFGIYGCDGREDPGADIAIEILQALMDEHRHIYTDTSGVSFDAIHRMLGLLNADRVVFGSDALYVPIYRQLALVMHALKVLGRSPEAVKPILSDNAREILKF